MFLAHGSEPDFTPAAGVHRWVTAMLAGAVTAFSLVAVILLLSPPEAPAGLAWPGVTLKYPGQPPAWFVLSASTRLGRAVFLLLVCGVLTAATSLVTLVAIRAAGLGGEVAIRRSVGASVRRLRRGWRREGLSTAGVASLFAWAGSLLLLGTAGYFQDLQVGIRVGLVLLAVGPLWAAAVVLAVHRTAGRLVASRDRTLGVLSGATRRPRPPYVRSVAQIALSVAVAGAALVTVEGLDRLAHEAIPVGGLTIIPELESGVFEAVRRNPDVASAGPVSLSAPGGHLGLGASAFLITQCGDCWEGMLPMPLFPVTATHFYVGPDTFTYVGVELVDGRIFEAGSHEVVVNRALAGRYFQGGRAIGKMVEVGPERTWFEVVGVVDGNPAPAAIGATDQPAPAIYIPVEHFVGAVEMGLPGPAHGMTATLASAGVSFGEPRPLPEYQALVNAPAARAFGVLSGLAVLVLIISLSGVSVAARLSTQRRRGELALRRAVGARRRDLKLLLSGEAIRTGLVGAGIGAWLGTFLVNVAYEVLGVPTSGTLMVLLAVAGLHLMSSVLAALPAAWEASRQPQVSGLYLD